MLNFTLDFLLRLVYNVIEVTRWKMKKYKFKYSLAVWLLLFAIAVLCAVGLVWNVLSALEYANLYPIKSVAGWVSALLCAGLLAFALSVIFSGRYFIKGDYLYTKFGFFTIKTEIDKIYQFTHFKKSDKLVMYFEDGRYTVIVISPKEYEDFILSVRKQNPSVLYNSKIDGEDTPD